MVDVCTRTKYEYSLVTVIINTHSNEDVIESVYMNHSECVTMSIFVCKTLQLYSFESDIYTTQSRFY